MRRLIPAAALPLILLLLPASAAAIPAFARRYETSCQTCHVAYPRLTPFGEAFRRNAYRFPSGGDATMQKREPLPLGTDAQKDRFPDAVWPGELPVELPLSLLLDGQLFYGPAIEAMSHGAAAATASEEAPVVDTGHAHLLSRATAEEGGAHDEAEAQLQLASLGGQVGLRAGGVFGDVGAFFAAVNIGGHAPIEAERANVIFTPLASPALLLKVGRFEPSLHGISLHRGLAGHNLRLTTTPVGNNPFAPEPFSTGLELSSVLFHRLGLQAAVVENATPGRYVVKDLYGRAEYKFGGLSLDGASGSAGASAWQERSVLVGGSYYVGKAEVGTSEFEQTDDFWRAGADLHGTFDDLMLDLVAARESHAQPMTGMPDAATVRDQLFGELTWIVTPVFFPSLRAEASREEHDGAFAHRWLGLATLHVLLRANLDLRAQLGVGAEDDEHPAFRYAGLAFSAAL